MTDAKVDPQALAERLETQAGILSERNRGEPEAGCVQVMTVLLDKLERDLREAAAALRQRPQEERSARQLLADLQAEYPLSTKQDCDECANCGPMVMCAEHSFISALHRQTWTTGAIERAGQRPQEERPDLIALEKLRDDGTEGLCDCATAYKKQHQGDPDCQMTLLLDRVLSALRAQPAPKEPESVFVSHARKQGHADGYIAGFHRLLDLAINELEGLPVKANDPLKLMAIEKVAALRAGAPQPAPAERTSLERTCATCRHDTDYAECKANWRRPIAGLNWKKKNGCSLWAGPQGAAGAGVRSK